MFIKVAPLLQAMHRLYVVLGDATPAVCVCRYRRKCNEQVLQFFTPVITFAPLLLVPSGGKGGAEISMGESLITSCIRPCHTV